jgi:hypothetical protein
MDRYEFGNPALRQERPHRLELCTIRKVLAHLDCRIGFGPGFLGDQFTILQGRRRLPFHDTTLFEPLGSMLSDDVLFLGDKPPNRVKKSFHRRPRYGRGVEKGISQINIDN